MGTPLTEEAYAKAMEARYGQGLHLRAAMSDSTVLGESASSDFSVSSGDDWRKLWDASLNIANPVYNLMAQDKTSLPSDLKYNEPGYSPFNDPRFKQLSLEPFADWFAGAQNSNAFSWYLDALEREKGHFQTVQDAGFMGGAAVIAAGVLSPENLLLGTQVAKVFTGAKAASRALRIGSLMAEGGALALAGETAIEGTRITHTKEEAAYATLGTMLLTGALGTTGEVVNLIRSGKAGTKVDLLDPKQAARIGKDAGAAQADMEDLFTSGSFWEGMSEVDQIKWMQASKENQRGQILAAMQEKIKDPAVRELVGANSTLGRIFLRPNSIFDPAIRAEFSPSGVHQKVMEVLSDSGVVRKSATLGQTVEASMWMKYAEFGDAHVNVMERIFPTYAQNAARSGKPHVGLKEFNEHVGRAIRRGGNAVDGLPDDLAHAVEEAANTTRSFWDNYAEDALHLGFITQADLDAVNATAQAYFPRVWNRNLVESNLAVRGQLKQVLAKHFKSEAKAEKYIDDMLSSESGSISFMREVNEAGEFQRRTLLIPDEELEPFLVNDYAEVMQDFVRHVTPQIEMARAFRVAVDGHVLEEAARIRGLSKSALDGDESARKALEDAYVELHDHDIQLGIASRLDPEAPAMVREYRQMAGRMANLERQLAVAKKAKSEAVEATAQVKSAKKQIKKALRALRDDLDKGRVYRRGELPTTAQTRDRLIPVALREAGQALSEPRAFTPSQLKEFKPHAYTPAELKIISESPEAYDAILKRMKGAAGGKAVRSVQAAEEALREARKAVSGSEDIRAAGSRVSDLMDDRKALKADMEPLVKYAKEGDPSIQGRAKRSKVEKMETDKLAKQAQEQAGALAHKDAMWATSMAPHLRRAEKEFNAAIEAQRGVVGDAGGVKKTLPWLKLQHLKKQKYDGLKDMATARDNLLNTLGRDMRDPGHFAMSVERNMRNISSMLNLGMITPNSIPTDAVMIGMVNGLTPTMKLFKSMSWAPLRTMKRLLAPRRSTVVGLRGAKLADQIGVDPSEVMSKAGAREDAIRFLGGVELAASDARYQRIGDIANMDMPRNPVERSIDAATGHFFRATYIDRFTGMLNKASGFVVMNRILDDVVESIEKGGLSRARANNLNIAGINESMARRIYNMYKKHGDVDADGVRYPRKPQGGNWEDRHAYESLRTAILQETRRTVLRPSIADRSRFLSVPFLRLLGSLQSFGMAANNKIFINGAQRMFGYGDMAAAGGFVALGAAGALTYVLAELISGRDPSSDPRVLAREAIDRGNLMGYWMFPMNVIESSTNHRIGLASVGLPPAHQFGRGGGMNQLGGAAYRSFSDLYKSGFGAGRAVLTGDGLSEGEKNSMWRLNMWFRLAQFRRLSDLLRDKE